MQPAHLRGSRTGYSVFLIGFVFFGIRLVVFESSQSHLRFATELLFLGLAQFGVRPEQIVGFRGCFDGLVELIVPRIGGCQGRPTREIVGLSLRALETIVV